MKIADSRLKVIFLAAALLAAAALPAIAAPHRYDHVVIVIEENRSVVEIIGDRVNAPYLNALADGGARIGQMFALTHPSQPNYFHLFSGEHQGVLDDGLPRNFSRTPTANYPMTAPNLGAALNAAGFTFAGYSEQLEAAGEADWADYDPHSDTDPNVHYRRKHNPWANWVAKVSPPLTNQFPASANLAFTQFPTNYARLPTVSFVVPNQLNDMHDGSRRQGDDWLRANLGAFASWARTNNSLLIVTWDEDDYNGLNQIPTIFHGAALREGTVTPGIWTLHDLLRTIEDMYGLPHAGAAAQASPMIGLFVEDPPITNVVFRQNLNGYTGVQDTHIWAETPSATNALNTLITADLDTATSIGGNQMGQILIRFDNLFGNETNQIPPNATIHAAKLVFFTPLNTSSGDYSSTDTFRVHRMLVDWNHHSTWNSLTNGVSPNNLEAALAASFSLTPTVDGAPAIFDVTRDLALFQNGAANRGWVLIPASDGTGNGWSARSSEAGTIAQRPTLSVIFSVSTNSYDAWALAMGLTATNNAPGLDPDRDGASNVREYACNLDPLKIDAGPLAPSSNHGLPAFRYLASVSGGILETEFLRRKGASGLTYETHFSGNLIDWSPAQSLTVTTISEEWELVRARDSVPGPAPHRFVKHTVSLKR